MAGPLHHAPATEEAGTAASPATTDRAACDLTGADLADDLTVRGGVSGTPPTAQTAADGSSDSSSDEHPIPFPPFSEQDEPETQSLGAAAAEQEAGNTTIVSSTNAAPIPPFPAPLSVTEPPQAWTELEAEDAVGPTEPTEPTGAAEPAETTAPAESTQLATEPVAGPATEPEPATEPAEPAQPAEAQPGQAPQAVVSPPPAPPPPYWTHSHADSQLNTSSSATTPALDADRLLANPSRAATAAPSTAAAAGPVSPAAAAAAAASSSAAPAGASYLPAHQHRRDTSSSSSLLHVDLITLQDNEALEQMDHSSCGSGACAIGAADDRLRALHQQLHRQQRCWARRVDLTDYVIVGGGGASGGGSGAGSGAGARLGAFVVWTVRVETLEGTAFSIHKRYSEFDALRRQLVASFPQATASHGGGSVTSLFGGRRPHPLGGVGGVGGVGGSGSSGSSSSRPASSSSGAAAAAGGRSAHAGNKKKGRSRSQSRSRKGAPPTALPPLPPKTVLGNFRPAFLEQRRLGLQYFLNCILLNPEFAGSPVLRDFLFS